MPEPLQPNNGDQDLHNFEKIKEMRLEMQADQKMKGSQNIYCLLRMAEIY